MVKFKIVVGNTTIEFATLQDAEDYLVTNSIVLPIVEFFDETVVL